MNSKKNNSTKNIEIFSENKKFNNEDIVTRLTEIAKMAQGNC